MMANSASMAAMAGSGGAIAHPAPMINEAFAAARLTSGLTGLTGPDGSGFFTYPGLNGSTMKIQFLKSDGTTPITNIQSADMLNLKYVHTVITSAYAFGTFTGDFTMLYDATNTDEETMTNGSIPCRYASVKS